MKRDEFLCRLNARSIRRYGVEVNQWKLQDWVKEGYFEGVAPGTHDWTVASYRTALQVCRLRWRGIEGANETRVHLWKQGATIPFDLLKASLLTELQRLGRALSRQTSTTFDGQAGEPSSKTVRGFAIQSDKASPLIHPEGFVWPAEKLAASWGVARSGENAKTDRNLIEPVLRHSGLDLGSQELSDIQTVAVNSLGGILGGDEISGSAQKSIEAATVGDFDNARLMYRQMCAAMAHTNKFAALVPDHFRRFTAAWASPVQNIAKAVIGKDWASLLLAICVHNSYRGRIDPNALIVRPVVASHPQLPPIS